MASEELNALQRGYYTREELEEHGALPPVEIVKRKTSPRTPSIRGLSVSSRN